VLRMRTVRIGWVAMTVSVQKGGTGEMETAQVRIKKMLCLHPLSSILLYGALITNLLQILMNVKLRLMTVLTTAQTQLGHMIVHVHMVSCFILMDYHAMVMIAQLDRNHVVRELLK